MSKQIQSQIDQLNQFMGLKNGDPGFFVLDSRKPGVRRIYKLARRCNGYAETDVSEGMYASEMKLYLSGMITGYVLATQKITS